MTQTLFRFTVFDTSVAKMEFVYYEFNFPIGYVLHLCVVGKEKVFLGNVIFFFFFFNILQERNLNGICKGKFSILGLSG